MPFPEKDYYKIIMELENEEYNNSNSNFGNNYNAADIAATSIFGNIPYHNYANNAGNSLFALYQYNNDANNTEGTGLFGNNNNITSLFGNTSGGLFGNPSANKFGISGGLFGNTSANKTTCIFGSSLE